MTNPARNQPLPVSEPLSDQEEARANGLAANPAAILGFLRTHQHFLVVSHARPDGDALGSTLAMGMLLDQLGKTADMVTADTVPAIYRGLPWADRIRVTPYIDAQNGPYDAVILLECDSLSRPGIDGLEPFFHINIDHHSSGKHYGDLNWIEPEAASVGEMVYRLVEAARPYSATLTWQMATCLYTTILTDTGGFCYGGTKTSTFELARILTAAGADPIAIAQRIYYSIPASKLRLLGAALSNLQHDGKLAWLWVTREDILRTHASEEDSEGVVDHAIGIAGVQAAAYFRELPDGRVRLSLRSKENIDVAAIAESLGGGGHENAAGITLPGPLEKTRAEILAILRAAIPCTAIEEQVPNPSAARS